MNVRVTRRKLAQTLLASAAAEAAAQTAPPAPADDLKAARDRLKATGDLLAGQRVPMDVEPAFQFKA